ncbi:porin [Alkalilimnicola ehrlichii MLHE-1]|uniref:Porin domain-containing protein n=1 Tax=Alkalilimnicola ehrlichii (strain ATCC BAA-1101 / DSM 17681 / MLHE-1) TaxID=187272 RepID=Q0A522_ALKEH|nr:porin [Alkalilimnicola ehrlichii]ABI58065.1 conserved hypothetical protein [Alkalilimnicola ehrlichii MLHE-1]
MRRFTTPVATAAGMAGLLLASAAQAQIEVEAGDWTLTFDGNVNAYYTNTRCESDAATVQGGLACTDAAESDRRANIRTGFLPAKLGIGASTTQNGLDIAAYVSYWPGVDGGDAVSVAGSADTGLGFGNVNFRQVFLTVGNERIGTFKLGRDLGIFGSDAILSDMSLLGVGTVSDITLGGGNTSLGRVGNGYLYADWKAQISYASPDFNGFGFVIGATDPFDPFTVAPGDNSLAAVGEKTSPAVEGKVTYDWTARDVSGRVWAGFINQKVDDRDGSFDDFRATGFDLGVKAGIAGFEGVAYYYEGKGIGTTAFLHQAASADGTRRDSDGFMLQGTYTLPGLGTKLGLSYGESNLDQNNGDPDTLLDRNSSVIVGAYHPITPNLNLVAEFTRTKAENHAGDDNREDNVALGAILFF